MRFGESLRKGLEAFAPRHYRSLTALPLRAVLSLCWSWFWLVVLLLLVAGIPKLYLMQDTLERNMDAFSTFSVSFNVSMDAPVVVSRTPLVVVDLEQGNLTNERVLLNEEGVLVRKAFWRGERFLPWETLSRVPENASRYSGWLMLFAVLLLPTLVLVVGLLFLVEALVLVSLVVLLGSVVTKIVGFRVSVRQMVKVAVLGLIPLMTLQLVPFFYVRLLLLPVVLYVVLVVVAVWATGESKLERRSGRSDE